ncbi:hypothetical protein Tco_1253192 [Tanacetum coccineum]
MSDSEDSMVTYTEVSSPFADSSDIGSPGVDGPPVLPEDPYAYVVAAFQAPPSPYFVPERVYPEFMPPEDEVLPAEDQPLPAAVSPTADSPGYIPESDPEEDSEEDPADYPTDGRDDDNDDDESSDDDEDDDEDVEEEEDEEEENLALANSVPPHVHRVMARISIPAQAPTPFWSEADVDRFLAIRTPPPSPLTPLSSPLPHIPSPPLPVSPPPPASPTHPLGYRAAMIRLRAEAPSTSHSLPLPPPIILFCTRSDAPPSETPPSGTPPLLPIPAPTSSPPLLLPSMTIERTDPRESSSVPAARPTGGFRADYGFVATLDDEIRRDPKRDDDKLLMSGQLNMLYRDRRAHARTASLMEREARLSCEAWVRSIDASDIAYSKERALRTTVLAHQDSIIFSSDLRKMAPKRATRSTRATKTTTTTSVTNAQLKALIDQGVAAASAARDTDRSMNGDDNHNSGTGVRRTERVA